MSDPNPPHAVAAAAADVLMAAATDPSLNEAASSLSNTPTNASTASITPPLPSSTRSSPVSEPTSLSVFPSAAIIAAAIPPKRGALKGEDAWKRMNYLYQSSHYSTAQGTTAGTNLSRFYLMNMKKIAAKLVMRMSEQKPNRMSFKERPMKCDSQFSRLFVWLLFSDPSIKNTVCKRCGSLLIPGITADLQVLSPGEAEGIVTINDQIEENECQSSSITAAAASDDHMEDDTTTPATSASISSNSTSASISGIASSTPASMSHDPVSLVAATAPSTTSDSLITASSSLPLTSYKRKRRLRRHRSSGAFITRSHPSSAAAAHLITICRTCSTRKRLHTKPIKSMTTAINNNSTPTS